MKENKRIKWPWNKTARRTYNWFSLVIPYCLFRLSESHFIFLSLKTITGYFICSYKSVISNTYSISSDLCYFILSFISITKRVRTPCYLILSCYCSHITWPWVYWVCRWSTIVSYIKEKEHEITLTSHFIVLIYKGQ